MEWTTTASLARVAINGYQNRHLIQKFWTKARAYADLGKTQIAITGNAGTGKTLLAAQMHGRARELFFDLPKESTNVEVEAITPGKWSKLVRVLPGQTSVRAKGEIEVFEGNDSLEGVIHVVDFGFTSPRDDASIATLIKTDQIDTLEKLRAYNLQAELSALGDLFVDIRRLQTKHKKPKWLVIAVNKIDLYCNERNNALNHYHPYGNGEFGTRLKAFMQEIGSSNLKVYIVQSCAYEKNFIWNGLETKSLLERQEQHRILKDLMSVIAALSDQ